MFPWGEKCQLATHPWMISPREGLRLQLRICSNTGEQKPEKPHRKSHWGDWHSWDTWRCLCRNKDKRWGLTVSISWYLPPELSSLFYRGPQQPLPLRTSTPCHGEGLHNVHQHWIPAACYMEDPGSFKVTNSHCHHRSHEGRHCYLSPWKKDLLLPSPGSRTTHPQYTAYLML